MKRFLLLLLALALILSACLVGCSPKDDPNEEDEPTEDDGTYKVTESYLPSAVSAKMKELFEAGDSGFTAPDSSNMPFMIMDELIISNCTVKSITVPVFKTGNIDESGNLYLTLSVVKGDYSGMKTTLASPTKTYKIPVNTTAFGLKANQKLVRKFIKISLEQYDIKLGKNETLAFGASSDTLIPAVLKTSTGNEAKSPAAQYFLDNWGVVRYYYLDSANKKALTINHNALIFDFELVRSYADKDAYDAMIAAEQQADAEYAAKVAAVKEAYQGKSLSVLGDSISTFGTISNGSTAYNPDYNPNSSNPLENRPYVNSYHQSPGGDSYKKEMMYWGKLAEDAQMDLNVVNAWSGSTVYGGDKIIDDNVNRNKVNMLYRCRMLANNGQNPDLILVYFGINDYLSSPSSTSPTSGKKPNASIDPTGDLYQRLTNKGNKTDAEVVGEWFELVLAKAIDAGYDPDSATPDVIPGTTYTTWEAAYALSLYYMLNHYDSPDIYMFTLVENNYNGQGNFLPANVVFRALAAYFEVGLIDQANGYREKATCHLFTYDDGGLHPNYKGHMLLEKFIVETIYDDLKKAK